MIWIYLLGVLLAIPTTILAYKDQETYTLADLFLFLFYLACSWWSFFIHSAMIIVEYWDKPIWRRKK